MTRATLPDLPHLVAMMAESYADAGFALNHERALTAFTALLSDDRLGSIWLLLSGDQRAGYLVVTHCYNMEYGGLAAILDDLFVRPPFRRTGLATAALTALRTLCVAQKIRALHVETDPDNPAAQSLYRRAGFLPNDRQHLTLPLATPTHQT